MQKLQQQNEMLGRQLEALKTGILVEKLDRYMRLAKAYQAEDSALIGTLERVIKELISRQGTLRGD